MQNILSLILIGFFLFLIFSRKGGMGCCGSHGAHEPKKQPDAHSTSDYISPDDRIEEVIDLSEDEYSIIAVKDEQDRTR